MFQTFFVDGDVMYNIMQSAESRLNFRFTFLILEISEFMFPSRYFFEKGVSAHRTEYWKQVVC